jgi:hypothetical protein
MIVLELKRSRRWYTSPEQQGKYGVRNNHYFVSFSILVKKLRKDEQIHSHPSFNKKIVMMMGKTTGAISSSRTHNTIAIKEEHESQMLQNSETSQIVGVLWLYYRS